MTGRFLGLQFRNETGRLSHRTWVGRALPSETDIDSRNPHTIRRLFRTLHDTAQVRTHGAAVVSKSSVQANDRGHGLAVWQGLKARPYKRSSVCPVGSGL